MLRSPFSGDFGLLYGKMGISLFFYEYGRYKEEAVYGDFAGELLDDIWEKIHKRVPIAFDSGLTGISWGIEYLIQNGFVEGNSNEICPEIDRYIMNYDIRRMIHKKFIENELDDFLHYLLARISGSVRQNKTLPFDPLYRNDLYHIFSSLIEKEISLSIKDRMQILLQYLTGNGAPDYTPDVSLFIKEKEIDEKKIYRYPLGLKDGLAGKLFNTLRRDKT